MKNSSLLIGGAAALAALYLYSKNKKQSDQLVAIAVPDGNTANVNDPTALQSTDVLLQGGPTNLLAASQFSLPGRKIGARIIVTSQKAAATNWANICDCPNGTKCRNRYGENCDCCKGTVAQGWSAVCDCPNGTKCRNRYGENCSCCKGTVQAPIIKNSTRPTGVFM